MYVHRRKSALPLMVSDYVLYNTHFACHADALGLLQDRGMAGALGSLRTLVFDEGDRLLDMGFR